MGQAVVDLPDPLEEQPASGASSADDLLSQLAGDEIDRMLTEADVETSDRSKVELDGLSPAVDLTVVARDAAAAVDATAVPDSAATNAVTTSTDLNASPAIALGAAPAASEPVAADANAAQHTAAELDALLGQALTPEAANAVSSATALESPAPTAAASAVTAADLDHDVAADADRVLAPHTAEHKADAATIVEHDERQELLATVAAESSEEPGNAPLPIWLRPLEWLNAPLEGLSDTFRENLGKVALLTIFNSVAAIAYVLIFRRH